MDEPNRPKSDLSVLVAFSKGKLKHEGEIVTDRALAIRLAKERNKEKKEEKKEIKENKEKK